LADFGVFRPLGETLRRNSAAPGSANGSYLRLVAASWVIAIG
jgi:hypothetical protein